MRIWKKTAGICLIMIMILMMGLMMTACGKSSSSDAAGSDTGIRHISFGEGEKTMVIIPGLSTGFVTDNEEGIEGAFADFTDEYTVYLFDVGENLPEDYTIEQISEDLAEEMISLGLSDTYIYGCSLGGMQGIYIAAEHPELVKKMVLASSACKANETSNEVVGKWIALAKEGKRGELTDCMGQYIYSPAVYEANKTAFAVMADGLTQKSLERFIRSAQTIIDLDLTEEAAEVKCPVLILGSKGDKVLTDKASYEMADIMGGEIYMYGEEYPHAVYDEAPDFKDRAKQFFDL